MLSDSIDAVGHASTTSAYVVGFDREAEMVSRLSALLAVPVAATCACAVLGLRALAVQRVALIGAPWFATELNDLGAAYFRSQGFDVVSSVSAELSKEPDEIGSADVVAWQPVTSETMRRGSSSEEAAFERWLRLNRWRLRSAGPYSRRIRSCYGTFSLASAPHSRSAASVSYLHISPRSAKNAERPLAARGPAADGASSSVLGRTPGARPRTRVALSSVCRLRRGIERASKAPYCVVSLAMRLIWAGD
jgi:hypothetical protein